MQCVPEVVESEWNQYKIPISCIDNLFETDKKIAPPEEKSYGKILNEGYISPFDLSFLRNADP